MNPHPHEQPKQQHLRQILQMPNEHHLLHYNTILSDLLNKALTLFYNIIQKITPNAHPHTQLTPHNPKRKQFLFKYDEIEGEDLNDTNNSALITEQRKQMVDVNASKGSSSVSQPAKPKTQNPPLSQSNHISPDSQPHQNRSHSDQQRRHNNSQTISLSQDQQQLNNGNLPRKMVKNDQTKESFLIRCSRMDLSECFYNRYKVIKEAYRIKQAHKETSKKRMLSQTTFAYKNPLHERLEELRRFKEERKTQRPLKKKFHEDNEEHLYDVSKVKQTLNIFREKKVQQKRQEQLRLKEEALKLEQQEEKRKLRMAQQEKLAEQAERTARLVQQKANKQRQESLKEVACQNKQEQWQKQGQQKARSDSQQQLSYKLNEDSVLSLSEPIQQSQKSSELNGSELVIDAASNLIKSIDKKQSQDKSVCLSEHREHNAQKQSNEKENQLLDNKGPVKANVSPQKIPAGQLKDNRNSPLANDDSKLLGDLSAKKSVKPSNGFMLQKTNRNQEQSFLNSSLSNANNNPFMNSPAKGPSLFDLINNHPNPLIPFQSLPQSISQPKETNNIFTSNIPVNNLFSPASLSNMQRKQGSSMQNLGFMNNPMPSMSNPPPFPSSFNSNPNNSFQPTFFQNIQNNTSPTPPFFNQQNNTFNPNTPFNNSQHNPLSNNINLSSNLATGKSNTNTFLADNTPRQYGQTNNLFLTPQPQAQPSLFGNIPSASSYQSNNGPRNTKSKNTTIRIK